MDLLPTTQGSWGISYLQSAEHPQYPLMAESTTRRVVWQLGHVIWMPENWLPHQLFYGKLSLGQRPVGRPKKHFTDHIRANLLKCHIKPCDLEAMASDRGVWKIVCETALVNFLNDWIAVTEERRANRHVAASKTKTGPWCRQCSRLCASQNAEPSEYTGQLSLVIPSWAWVGTMSTGQRAVMLCDWGVKADMALFAGNTVWSISERVRGVCVDALYKSTFTLLYFTLYINPGLVILSSMQRHRRSRQTSAAAAADEMLLLK